MYYDKLIDKFSLGVNKNKKKKKFTYYIVMSENNIETSDTIERRRVTTGGTAAAARSGASVKEPESWSDARAPSFLHHHSLPACTDLFVRSRWSDMFLY